MRFVKNCWVTLVGGVYGMLLAGTVYGFGSFSASLKSVLKVDEQTKQLIGVCGNLGLWVNVIGGMLSRRFGPAPTILSGTVLATAGYAGMYAVLHGHQTAAPRHGSDSVSSSAIAPCICWFAVGLGCGWTYITTLFTVSANFEARNRSYVIGVLTAVFGASSPFFAVLKEGLVGNSIARFMALCAISCFFLGSFCAACMAKIPQAASNDASAAYHSHPKFSPQARFSLLAVLLSLLLALVFGAQLSNAARSTTEGLDAALFAVVAAVPVILAGSGAFRESRPDCASTAMGDADAPLLHRPSTSIRPDVTVDATTLAKFEGQAEGDHNAVAGDEVVKCDVTITSAQTRQTAEKSSRADPEGDTPCEVLRKPIFFVLSYVVASVVATNVMVLNMLSTIVKDRQITIGGDTQTRRGDFAVILMLTFSCSARFVVGVLMYHLGPVRWAPRFLLTSACLSVMGQLSLIFDLDALLLLGVTFLGVSDGTIWCSSAWLVMQSFGAAHTATIYGIIVFSVAIFSSIVSFGIEAAVYAAQPSTSNSSGDQQECSTGIHCFRTTHIVACVLTSIAMVCAAVFMKWFRSRFGIGTL